MTHDKSRPPVQFLKSLKPNHDEILSYKQTLEDLLTKELTIEEQELPQIMSDDELPEIMGVSKPIPTPGTGMKKRRRKGVRRRRSPNM